MEDRGVKYCKLCLVTDVKMFSLNSPSILEAYSQLVQVVICQDLHMCVCFECVCLLRKYQEFRFKCLTALNVLSSIHMDSSKVSKEVLKNIDRNHFNLQSKLECCTTFVCCVTDQSESQKDCIKTDETLFKNDVDSNIKIEIDAFNIDFKNDDSDPCDTLDQETNISNTILLKSENDAPEIKKKLKCVPKLKKSRVRAKSSTKTKRKLNTIVEKPKDRKSIKTRSRNKVLKKEVSEEIDKKRKEPEFDVSHFKDYATVITLSPEETIKEMLLRKESTNYKANPFKCDYCYRGYEFKEAFDNHMKKHSPTYGSWECEYCHVRFTTKKVFYYHASHVHKRKFICQICPYICYDTKQAKAHMNRHKGKKFICKECGEVFSMANSLCSHKRLRHPREVVCALCGSTFSALQGLNSHQKLLHRQDSTELLGPKCEECDVQFATETAWKRHLVLSSKHKLKNGCKYCGEILNSKAELRIHSKLHPGKTIKKTNTFEPPAACRICDKWLATRGEHKEHMTSQHPQAEEQKQFVCEVCGMSFKLKTSLQNHRNKHTGDRPYECLECGKTYTQRSSLYIHERTHHTATSRVFQCDTCNKQYSAKGALAKHIKTHFGIRPYKCQFCDNSYHHKCEMKYHMDYVHFKKPWPKRDRTKRRNT